MIAQSPVGETVPADVDARPKPSRLTPGRSLWTGMSIWLVGIVVSVVGVVLFGINGNVLASHPAIPVYSVWVTSGLPYLILGGLIVARRPENSIGWILSLGGLAGVVSFAAEQYAVYGLLTHPNGQPLAAEAAWLSYWLWLLWILFYPFFILLYPDGKPPTPRWRWVVWLDVAILVVICLPSIIIAWPVRSVYLFTPSVISASWEALFDATFGPLVLISMTISLVAAIVRYRAAASVERAQIRWLIYGVAVVIVYSALQGPLLANTPLKGGATALARSSQEAHVQVAMLLVYTAATIGFLIPALCVGVAIFRYHLFDIDRLINHTIVYGVLTAILAGVYALSVAVLQEVLRPVLGAGNDLAIVVTTLLIAALFFPLRSLIQRFIDRRFYRRKYDAARTLAAFEQVARDEVDLGALANKLVGVVEETMQPEHASLWLRHPETK